MTTMLTIGLAVLIGATIGVFFMALMFMARRNTEDDNLDLLGELERNNLSLSRIEDEDGVYWACSTGTPRVVVGTVSPSPALAIMSAVTAANETALEAANG